MKLNELSRVQKLYSEIKRLDREILNIEKLAEKIGCGHCEITLDLKVVSQEEKRDAEKIISSGIEDAYREMATGLFFSMHGKVTPKEKTTGDTPFSFNDQEALLMLATILKIKCDHRDDILGELHQKGIEI